MSNDLHSNDELNDEDGISQQDKYNYNLAVRAVMVIIAFIRLITDLLRFRRDN